MYEPHMNETVNIAVHIFFLPVYSYKPTHKHTFMGTPIELINPMPALVTPKNWSKQSKYNIRLNVFRFTKCI